VKGRQTTVLAVRVPDELYLKVKRLAEKRHLTMNDWLKQVVAAAAKYGGKAKQTEVHNEGSQTESLSSS